MTKPQTKASKLNHGGRDIYIVDGARTPFIKATGIPGPFTASDLAVRCGNGLLSRQPFAAEDLDGVIIGCVSPAPDEANIGRVISLRLGCGKQTPAYTVQRNCASGMQAIDSAAMQIAMGRAELVLAGGTESMSHIPLILNRRMVTWLGQMAGTRNFPGKLAVMARFRPEMLKPIVGLLRGLTDPFTGLSMGQTAENIASRFNISREQMDSYAVRSHDNLVKAQDNEHLDEIIELIDRNGHVYQCDNGVRKDSSIEQLARLKPVFDRRFGNITAGNSSQVTDGAALLILASADAVDKHDLPVLGRIVDSEWAGLAPEQMGLGPVHATTPILMRQQLNLDDIDYWEINEAFAAQVLACTEAWKDTDYCSRELGLDAALGEVGLSRLNLDGGGISLGHPVGASGARIVLHALHVLHRRDERRAVATLCIGGGQGGAMLLERA